MSMTPQDALQRAIEHREIFHDEMLDLMRQIMSGQMSPVMIAAITVALRVAKHGGRAVSSQSGSADACLRNVSGMDGSCCGAVESNDRLEPRLRSSQTRPRRGRTTPRPPIPRKSCEWNRVTAVFRFKRVLGGSRLEFR